MLNAPTALTVTAAPLRQVLQGHGIDFDSLARRAGLDPGLMSRPNACYPHGPHPEALGTGGDRVWRSVLGMKVGAITPPGVFHALGLGIVSSASVTRGAQAGQTLQQHRRAPTAASRWSNMVRWWASRRDRAIRRSCPRRTGWTPWWSALCRLLEQCAGPSAVPAKVIFMRPRAAPARRLSRAAQVPRGVRRGPHRDPVRRGGRRRARCWAATRSWQRRRTDWRSGTSRS